MLHVLKLPHKVPCIQNRVQVKEEERNKRTNSLMKVNTKATGLSTSQERRKKMKPLITHLFNCSPS